MELKTWGDIKPIGLEPTRPGYLTGPRAKPLGDLPYVVYTKVHQSDPTDQLNTPLRLSPGLLWSLLPENRVRNMWMR
jgi:hypothetical protein